MGILDRLSGMVKGKVGAAVSDLERRNPEAVYTAAIDGAKARIVEYRQAAAGLVAKRNQVQSLVERLETELVRVDVAAAAAVQEADDDTALVLLHRKQEITDKLEVHIRDVVALDARADEAREGLRELKEQVKKLHRERDQNLAQLAAAEAAIEVQEAASGLSDDPQARALASVRESIGVLEARAGDGYVDADGHSVRGRAEQLGRKAAEGQARAQLEALKRQLRGGDVPADPPEDGQDDAPDDDDGPKGRTL